MKVEFEITDDARVFVTVDDNHLGKKQVSHLLTKPSPAEWEQLQRVLLHTFKQGTKARSREIAALLGDR